MKVIIRVDAYGRRPNKISGGTRTSIQEHPSIVSIRFYGQHICGGVFITTRHILTAGHCLSDDDESRQGIVRYPKSLITVASGTNNCYHPANVHKIKSFTIHPQYRGSISNYVNDIAIIELEDTIKPNESRQIAKLPREDTSPNVDATVVGWGTSYEGEKILSELLKKADVLTIDNHECQSETRNLVYAGQLCATQPWGIGFCDGDSGGPLYSRSGECLGIVSMSIDCGKGIPDIYTRVFHYLQWIKATIK
ncbi:hypothetical protein KQX54_016884 [Cotesia glomerata]|uniref:Peptidase S1 domain-containing protein n=1 Tax=Cotesia glomerata TaxID=32391 RepID=A0AAV7I8K4_COTGL|nr:hypothetical protein KQX54_016884 [Cotesia glomerata]